MSTVKRKRSSSLEGSSSTDGNSGSNKDDKNSDKWSEELHRLFVHAIYDAGVSQSSPSVIMENMTDRPSSLTSERVKSHLQKYRKNREKSREDFMAEYDAFLRKALTVGGATGSSSSEMMTASAVIEMMGGQWPSGGGETAAITTYSVMADGDESQNHTTGKHISASKTTKDCQDYLKTFVGTNLSFPQLTEEEKRSPLGISMVYVMGLFSSLSQHTLHERRKRLKAGNEESKQQVPIIASASIDAATTTPKITDPTPKTFATFANRAKNLINNVQWNEQLTVNTENRVPPGPTVATANFNSGGDLPALNPGPPPNMGLFHPVLAKPELMEQQKTSSNTNNHWKVAMHPATTPLPTFAETHQKPPIRNDGPTSPNPHHKGPQAPV